MPLTKPPRRPPHTQRRRKELMQNPPQEALLRAAEAARYVSSPYHRSPGSPMGAPLSRRAHASLCPPTWDQIEANRVLKAAIREGRVSTDWRSAFPSFAWHLDGEVLYEARLSNQDKGEYHGYPLESREEWPKGLDG
jgi:hypothetical protein